jgi:LAS superfamily LD-carboxypeptidase LdcB
LESLQGNARVVELSDRQLTGLDETHLVPLADGHRLVPAAAAAFARLQADAAAAGFDLQIASSFRSFARQLAIWNGKAAGERPLHDDAGRLLSLQALSTGEKLAAILRYSALPGTSRHHWGTDLDVFDAAAVRPPEKVELVPAEVAPGGVFDALHRWLDSRMATGESYGFYRPYARDRGGVAVERWHLSYAPLALGCARRLEPAVVRAAWAALPAGQQLALRELVEAALEEIFSRYVEVGEDWCRAR